MDDLKRLLKQSVIEYALVSNCLDTIHDQLLKPEPKAMTEVVEDLHLLQQQAQTTDQQLEGRLQDYRADTEAHDLIRRRTEIMARILDKNRLIFDQTSGMLAVKATELTQMRSCRSAMTGYKSKQSREGSVLRRSY